MKATECRCLGCGQAKTIPKHMCSDICTNANHVTFCKKCTTKLEIVFHRTLQRFLPTRTPKLKIEGEI